MIAIGRRATLGIVLLAVTVTLGGCSDPPEGAKTSPADTDAAGNHSKSSVLRVVVMDPLASALACDCVQGYAQRDYDALGDFLSERLGGRPVTVVYAEGVAEGEVKAEGSADLVIGKTSVVLFDARTNKTAVRPVAMLTGKDGRTTFRGLFVVRSDDPAKSLADLKPSYRLRIGPTASAEKHAAAIDALRAGGASTLIDSAAEAPGCNIAAINVVERDADVAVISSYAMPLLEGCDTVDRGALRVIGHTADVPFVGVFVANHVSRQDEQAIADALTDVSTDAALLAKLESKVGFVAPSAAMRQMTDAGGP